MLTVLTHTNLALCGAPLAQAEPQSRDFRILAPQF